MMETTAEIQTDGSELVDSVTLELSLKFLATSPPWVKGHERFGPILWGRPIVSNRGGPSNLLPVADTAGV